MTISIKHEKNEITYGYSQYILLNTFAMNIFGISQFILIPLNCIKSQYSIYTKLLILLLRNASTSNTERERKVDEHADNRKCQTETFNFGGGG